MRVRLLTVGVLVLGSAANASGGSGPPVPVDPAPPPVTMAALHNLVSPAVVALLVSGGPAPARVVPGVLTTASGFVLTSRSAVAEAVDGRAMLTMLRAGPGGRLGTRELAGATPVRFVAVSPELDLALVEAMPATSVFFPHVPIARRSASAGATVLGVAHVEKRGLWTTATTALGPEAPGPGKARWLRELPADGAALPLGTPLFDAVGRVVALVASPSGGGPRAVDADGLLRFMLEANAPALRFAGVPPFRRPGPGETRGPAAVVGSPRGETKGAKKDAAKEAPRREEALMEGLARVKRRGLSAPGVSSNGNPSESAPGSATASKGEAPPPDASPPRFGGIGNALVITAAELDKRLVPAAAVTVDVRDVPERGPRSAAVTIIELGDYHAPETREAEATLKALAEGPDAKVRWLWKDADRGEGQDYQLPARAAHAAGEQDEFWAMHDILMKAPMPISMKDVRRIASAFQLELPAFDAAYASEGLVGALDLDAAQAARLPALATPAFIVNGRLVDGGSVTGSVLRAAVEEEVLIAEAKRTNQAPAVIEALMAGRVRGIAAGKPVAGATFDATKLARTVTAALARQSGPKH